MPELSKQEVFSVRNYHPEQIVASEFQHFPIEWDHLSPSPSAAESQTGGGHFIFTAGITGYKIWPSLPLPASVVVLTVCCLSAVLGQPINTLRTRSARGWMTVKQVTSSRVA